jgi:hypothetical protein
VAVAQQDFTAIIVEKKSKLKVAILDAVQMFCKS